MRVHFITPQGYCHGVVRAMRIAKQIGDSTDGPVYGLGQMVHNRHMIDDLAKHHVDTVDGPDRLKILEQIQSGTVIFTAHGVSPQVRTRALEKGLRVIDATCPDVTRTHDLVKTLVAEGYYIVYIGRHGHPEPEGVMGNAPGRIFLVETVGEVDQLDLPEGKRAVTTQTTMSLWDTQDIIDRLKERYPDIEVYNEICTATQDRQTAAVEQAKLCDVVIVVGDERSSNTNRLVDAVRERAGKPAYRVDSASEIRTEWLQGASVVGVTSGASTKTQITREVVHFLEALPDPVETR
ncbi:MAG: 4-hydroxy-3-methylbut-2-enyl diphosphate reductase [Chloroflexi bacterium]|nr:4-hydroxy-3-methylbut-2-enyl diphosphate reductase [Chloroflexota bacterium]